uniref:Kinesin-associated protein 3 n=1 Tax=Ditylenchus dipsaci TaxID=166011 RepID=A0A915DGA9_9BILA
MDNKNIRNIEIDAHSIEPAVVVRYEVAGNSADSAQRRQSSLHGSSLGKTFQKIIHLKDLNEFADSSAIAQVVLEMCPIIPVHRILEVEQIIFYIQKRASTSSSNKGDLSEKSVQQLSKAKLQDIESYIEMMYEDADKAKAISNILDLTQNLSNLNTMIENEVLLGALARVFREDSKKNFELATNIANIFLKFSQYSQFQSTLSHYKVGALTMQLIEHELKRWELWKEQAKEMNENAQRKWDFAMKKQDQLITAGIKLLLNLADDVRVENKMVKRGMIPILMKCLEHKATFVLLLSSVNFLWKLSAFTENRQVMESLGVLEKRMVNAGIVNYVAPAIATNEIGLSLLYQLSILDDAKAMITFTDAIQTLTRMLLEKPHSNLVNATLVNITLEKRNAQLICLSDGQGLDSIMSFGLENEDLMVLKIARNISMHEGPTHEMFYKWMPQLLENAISGISVANKVSGHHIYGMECLGICSNISTAPWNELEQQLKLVDFLSKCLSDKKEGKEVGDDVCLQAVLLCSAMSLHLDTAKQIGSELMPLLISLLNKKQEEDEFVLQILHVFFCLLTHSELAESLCGESSPMVEYFINLMHDKNPRLRSLCDQALQLVSESNKYWSKRIAEEKFRWHNVHWLEMVSGASDVLEELESLEHLNGMTFDADEILDGDDYLKSSLGYS